MSQADSEIVKLIILLWAGALERDDWWAVSHWFSHRGEPVVKDDALIFKGCVEVPTENQHQNLVTLHGTYQGQTHILLVRASESVWWRFLTLDVAKVWAACKKCAQEAPS